MTALNRKLAMSNLAQAAQKRELRRRQAAEYYRCLEPLGLIRGFDGKSLPESHFPIRVAEEARNPLRRYLAGRGIDTATYFPFPRGLERAVSAYESGIRRGDSAAARPVYSRRRS